MYEETWLKFLAVVRKQLLSWSWKPGEVAFQDRIVNDSQLPCLPPMVGQQEPPPSSAGSQPTRKSSLPAWSWWEPCNNEVGPAAGGGACLHPKRLHCLQEFLPGMYMGPGTGHNPCCHLNSVPSLKCCFIFSLRFIFSSIKYILEGCWEQESANYSLRPGPASCLFV